MNAKKPLEGLRVVEYCMWIAAPGGPLMLGDLGAEVIKVEDMIGDPFRRMGTMQGAPIKGQDGEEMNPWFDATNYNKNYVCINTKTPEGLEIFYELLATADAFVTSVRQDVLVRRGLDYDTISKKFPKLPYIHFLGYGEKGPLKDKPAFDVATYFGAGGYLYNSVPEYSEYLANFPVANADCWSAGYTACAILTGILESKMHGVGDYLTLSLYGEAYWSQRLSLIQYQYGVSYPCDPLKPGNPIINNYKTKDGRWVILCVSEYNRYINEIMRAIDREDLVDHPVYGNDAILKAEKKEVELSQIIAAAFKTKTAAELHEAFGSRDLPLEDCATYGDLLESEQGWANQYMEKINYPNGETSIAFTQPITSRNAGPHSYERSKRLGFHNDLYLGELGYSQEKIDDLRGRGVIK